MSNPNPTHKFQIGHPNYSPKKEKSFAGILRAIGESYEVEVSLVNSKGETKRFFAKSDNNLTLKEAICAMVYANALRGDRPSMEMIMERTEGKVKEFEGEPEEVRKGVNLKVLSDEELMQYKLLTVKLQKKNEVLEAKKEAKKQARQEAKEAGKNKSEEKKQ